MGHGRGEGSGRRLWTFSQDAKTKWEVSGSREERTKPGWCVSKGLEAEKEDGCQGGAG